ncbi:MAG: hypothetical protein JWM80_1657 [Cyanobacteria bacterium RYN_339]|nr:hypothetical protein [Cyanobacteria bacterium RYN_339]
MAGPVQRAPKPVAGSKPWLLIGVGLLIAAALAPSVPGAVQGVRGHFDEASGRALAERIAKAHPGEIIKIAAGRYVLPAPLHITQAIHLIGAGADRTTLLGSGDDYLVVLGVPNGAISTVKGLTLAHAPNATGNILEITRGHVVVEGCNVQGGKRSPGSRRVSWAGTGIVGGPGSDLTLVKVTVEGNRGGGLTTRGNVHMTDVDFRRNMESAFELHDGAHGGVTRLHLESNQDGIKVTESKLEISNSILETSGTALYLGYNSHGIVRSNQILHNRIGLTVELGTSAIVAHNRITDNPRGGIRIDPRGVGRYGASRVTASDNQESGNQ